ncbi:MAG: NPCBM/NEW2 domain-containing protein [Planctomycetaceae bacterium]|nr:NPCBM/NEW2 domain-containing protein [Planctomycetaceae bacterium]
MIGLLIGVWLAAGEGPKVDVLTLEGGKVTGTLLALSLQEVTVETANGPSKIAAAELLEIRVPEARPVPTDPANPLIAVRWQSGALSSTNAVVLTGTKATLQHPALGEMVLSRDAIRSFRFGTDDAVVREAWMQLHERTTKKDFLVVRKGDVLDHLDGVAGTIDANEVRFRLDGEDVTVKREKVYGIIYARRDDPAAKFTARVELAGGDTLLVKEAQWTDEAWQFAIPGVAPLKVPANAVQSLDFSLSKFLYLSKTEPRDIRYTPFFDDFMFEVQRDRDFDGRPLRVGERTFPRGLAVHSKTSLKYRLGGDYRYFKSVVGLDPKLPLGAFYGDAHVVIRGDDKVLYEADFISGQEPETLDLAVSGVIELEILVDFGRDKWDLGDRVHFGDAKVVK